MERIGHFFGFFQGKEVIMMIMMLGHFLKNINGRDFEYLEKIKSRNISVFLMPKPGPILYICLMLISLS
jgi:hypothetical protein